MDCSGDSMDEDAATVTTICVRNEDTENINPIASSSPPTHTTTLAVVTDKLVSPEEEAVCAVDWHPGFPGDDDENDGCPACDLGKLRWYYLNEESMIKLCNNLLCNHPLDSKDGVQLKPKSVAEMEEDAQVESLFDFNPYSSRVERVNLKDILDEMHPLVDKYIDNEDDE